MRKSKGHSSGNLGFVGFKDLARRDDARLGITLHIQQVSNEFLRMEEGSLYPALHRMEREGWISAEWKVSENNRRARYYRLTPAGRKQLAEEERNWRKLTEAVSRVLTFAAPNA